MADEKLLNAVREIERCAHTLVVANAAQKALAAGTNEALIAALVTARETTPQAMVHNIASKTLGLKKSW